MITLAIDYGASNVGIALVRNTEAGNEPLFAGTVILDASPTSTLTTVNLLLL
jgi:RNase H-fold protein (predicted Holliday junction resolvase)